MVNALKAIRQMNQHLRDFIGLLSSKVVRAVINLLLIVLLARILGPDGLGEWAMIIAAGTLLHLILLSWMHAPTVRFGREEWQREHSVTTTLSSRLPYLLIGFIITFGLIILDPAQWLERYYHLSDNLKLAVILVSLWLWLSTETQNYQQLQGTMLRLACIPVLVDSVPILMLITISISGVMVPVHVLITGLLTLSVILWGIALFWELMHLKVELAWPGIEAFRKTFTYSWPLIPGLIFGYVTDWGDQLLLRNFFTSHEVGLFQSAYQFMTLLLGVATPLGTILLPRLIDKEMLSVDTTKEFLASAGSTIVTLGLFLLLPVVSLAPLFFRIFMGSKFAEANLMLLVLCAAVPGSIISIFYGTFFKLQNRLWRSIVIYFGIMGVVNIVISLILLPRVGMIGSAVGTGISFLVLQFLYLFDQHRYYRISLVKIGTLFGAIVAFAILQVFVGSGLIFRSVLCLFSLAALVLLSRIFSLLDRKWVLQIMAGKLSGLGNLLLLVTES